MAKKLVDKNEHLQDTVPPPSSGTIHMKPLDTIAGFPVRPGFYESNGATAIPCGVNFTIHSQNATSCELLLYRRTENKPYAIIKIPEHYKIGNVYSIIVFDLNIEEFEYAYRMDGPYEPEKGLIFDKTKTLLDPYAKAVTGQSVWGTSLQEGTEYKARVVRNDFDWGGSIIPLIPMEDLIIYELHVRGFTKHPSSNVYCPGTFAGLIQKIPYLKELGINAVELMPIFEFDETRDLREYNGNTLLDYWGYNPVCFFSPNTSYTAGREYNREGTELKTLIKDLQEYGIEVFLDVVFNHTSEGDERGPYFSFKGVDNNVYYLLTPDGKYYNFSGCGNTLNCNNPIVQQMILECLRYWVIAYRVDGFRFDLASILGRNEDGSPMNQPPLLQSLAFDPILGNVKLIAEAWDAGGLYQVGTFPSFTRWSEWNGKYRDDMRSFLKGDYWFAPAAAQRITGSRDLYNPEQRGSNSSVNFLDCHDGFTLYDLYSYNTKHNEGNGWNNTDGADDNRSWNCGVEGETDDPEVNRLRRRLIRNACAVLLCSRGIPMFLAGDEFGNSQFGNNNPYCQDNEISWLDWSLLEKNHDIFQFFKGMIQFRKDHVAIRRTMPACTIGFPDMSIHTENPHGEVTPDSKVLCVLFAGRNEDDSKDDVVYLAINVHWEKHQIYLPTLPSHMHWRLAVNTYSETPSECIIPTEQQPIIHNCMDLEPRSVYIFLAHGR